MFYLKEEKNLNDKYLKDGYLIFDIKNNNEFNKVISSLQKAVAS